MMQIGRKVAIAVATAFPCQIETAYRFEYRICAEKKIQVIREKKQYRKSATASLAVKERIRG